MAPYEAFYYRMYQSPLCWYESIEQSLLGLEFVRQTTKDVKRIREQILTAQNGQKSYVDQRRKPFEFQEGDNIFLKITTTTGIGRVMRAYQIALPLNL